MYNCPTVAHTLPAGSVVQHKTSPSQGIEVTLGVERKQALPSLAGIEKKKSARPKVDDARRNNPPKKYGASEDALDKINTFAHEHNLQVTHSEPGSGPRPAGGTVEDISNAFDVTLFDYHHDKLGDFHGHTGPVSIPVELKGAITGVFGFNNHRHLRRHQATSRERFSLLRQLLPSHARLGSRHRIWAGSGFCNFSYATGKNQCIGLL